MIILTKQNISELYENKEYTNLKPDLYDLLEARRTTPVEMATEQLRNLWEWYALDCLKECSRKTWKWHSASCRSKDLMTNCVAVSDEALLLQILILRGEHYLGLKYGVRRPRKRGRNKVDSNDTSTIILPKKLDLFNDL
jgi:hypothetical protein